MESRVSIQPSLIRSEMFSKTLFMLFTVILGCIAEKDGDVRLVNGKDSQSGAVEVFYNQRWGRVCADGFSIYDADVVCKQVSGKSLLELKNGEYSSSLPYVVNKITCQGSETSISQCHITPGSQCVSDRSAGVNCGDLGVTGTLGLEAGIIAGIVVASVSLVGVGILAVGCLYRNACCKGPSVA